MFKTPIYYFLMFLFFLCASALQSTFLNSILGSFKPNLHLILIIYVALNRNITEGGFITLAAGYFLDIFSGSPQGFFMLSSVLTFFAIKILAQALYVHTFRLEVLSVFVGSLLFFIMNIILFLIFTNYHFSMFAILFHTIISAVLNTLIAYFAFPWLTHVDLWMNKKREKKVVIGAPQEW